MSESVPKNQKPSDLRPIVCNLSGRAVTLYSRCSGEGMPVLFLHEFACGSYSWEKMIPLLTEKRRWIRLDLAGFGAAPAVEGPALTLTQQAELVEQFVEQENLRNLTIVGHGMGGEIALYLAAQERMKDRLDGLILISCGAKEPDIPDFIRNIGHSVMTKPILRMIHSGFVARMFLEYAYAAHRNPDPELQEEYAEKLRDPKRIASIIEAARAYARMSVLPELKNLKISIFAGDEDRILPCSASEALHNMYPGSTMGFLSGCGHLPQEECPHEMALLLDSVLAGKNDVPQLPPATLRNPEKLRLRSLIDDWNPGTILLIIGLKILQFFRKFGVRVEQESWRHLSGIFLKREYSKFIIAVFRLNTPPGNSPEEIQAAFEQKLHQFMMNHAELHWAEERHFFFSGRKRQPLCDLMIAETSPDGELKSITPHFDPRAPVSGEEVNVILQTIIDVYNANRHRSDESRPIRIQNDLQRKIKKLSPIGTWRRQDIFRLGDRIMSATFLFYEPELPGKQSDIPAMRYRTPDLKNHRHPGWGLSNLLCRFSADRREIDIWWQFNHVMVDGAPMQEILRELKQQWGGAGELLFPALGGAISQPEIIDCGNRIYRIRFFADFTPLLRLRSSLNRMCYNEMAGKASFPALLMWGLSLHPAFRNRKMLLPVDIRTKEGERRLGLLIVRPSRFAGGSSPLSDFCRFQTEINNKLHEIRYGYTETSELLALGSMLHPLFYWLIHKLAPKALEELVGTMGLSIIADAEVFVSPLTDFQINGFLSLGSVLIPTQDQRRAGSVCVCGTRDGIELYYEAMGKLIHELPHLLMR